jgi:hypothetical protein
MDFHFKTTDSLERSEIIFAKKDQIFTLNFMNKEINVLYHIKVALTKQPQYFKCNDD